MRGRTPDKPSSLRVAPWLLSSASLRPARQPAQGQQACRVQALLRNARSREPTRRACRLGSHNDPVEPPRDRPGSLSRLRQSPNSAHAPRTGGYPSTSPRANTSGIMIDPSPLFLGAAIEPCLVTCGRTLVASGSTCTPRPTSPTPLPRCNASTLATQRLSVSPPLHTSHHQA